jgi:alanine racemase
MVMNPEESTYDALLQFDLEPDIYSLEQLQHFDAFLQQQNIQQFPVHIELETGMNRLGFSLNDLDELKAALAKSSFKVQSVFSHLAASEDPKQDAFTQSQGEQFLHACSSLEQILNYPFIKHLANSAAIIRHPQWQLDMVRLGIGLYGIDSASSKTLDLQEVSALKTTIAQVKHIKAGESVGYGRKAVGEN